MRALFWMALFAGLFSLADVRPAAARTATPASVAIPSPAARNHAPSLLDLGGGRMLVCWYGGREEANQDVALFCANSEDGGRRWSPARVALEAGASSPTGGASKSLGNPSLFRVGARVYMAHGVIVAEPLCRNWACGRVNIAWSDDGGATWSQPLRLVDVRGALPRGQAFAGDDGALLLPIYVEGTKRSVLARLSFDAVGALRAQLGPPSAAGLIQPTLARRSDGAVFAYFRDRAGRAIRVARVRGAAFEKATALALPNPDSAVEAVEADGGVTLIFNPNKRDRRTLALAHASDGMQFSAPCVIVEAMGDVAYPSAVRAREGDLVIAFSARDKSEIRVLRTSAAHCQR